MNPVPEALAWPTVHLARRPHGPEPTPSLGLERGWAQLALSDGDRALVDRYLRSATLLTASPAEDGRMVHPFLTVVGSLFGWWLGHDLFHGGALSVSGRGWMVIGEDEAGKSSLLAQLAATGYTVMADDLVVIDDGCLLAGPRCVDLRAPALDLVELSGPTELVRGGNRHRLRLDPAPPLLPLGGWIFLSWGSRLRARPLGPGERLRRLLAERCAGDGLLELARLPGWELERPWENGSIAAAAEVVLELAAG